MVLPVPDMSSLSFLSALTTDCDVNVFASKYLGIILDKLWEQEIKSIFIVDFFFYMVFCIWWAALVTTVRIIKQNCLAYKVDPPRDDELTTFHFFCAPKDECF